MELQSFKLDSPNFEAQLIESLAGKGGIYKIYCQESEGERIPTKRLLDEDPEGTLYIGKGGNLAKRVIDLKKSLLCYENQSHICGRRYYHDWRTGIREKYPVSKMQVAVLCVDKPGELENKELKAYLARFGDLPPLNKAD